MPTVASDDAGELIEQVARWPHRPGVRQVHAAGITGARDRDAHAARAAQMRLQQLLETIHTGGTIEFLGPPNPQAPRVALARAIDVDQRFCLKSPSFDE